MARKIAQFLPAALLFGLSTLACAAATPLDIFDAEGVPGTGGNATIVGPCYCQEPAYRSPVLLLQPGNYDFGALRDYWVQSGPTPDGGPDQPNLYLLFAPVFTSGTYPDDFPPPSAGAFASTALCAQDDAACNAVYRGAYVDFDLVYTVPSGENAAQLELIGNYLYTSPLPEPLPGGMLAVGLALVVGLSKKRLRKAALNKSAATGIGRTVVQGTKPWSCSSIHG